MTYDLIIVGGGAAATSAAVYASRRNLKFKLITEVWGGEVARSGKIGNYPGFIQTDGIKLSGLFKQQLEKNNVEIEEGVKIGYVAEAKDGLELQGSSKKYQTKTVLLATGAHPRKLKIPGETELEGKGVTYCTTCDGPLFKGKEVAVVGGGNTALEAGLMMAKIAKKVFMVNINNQFSGEKTLIDNLRTEKNVEVLALTEIKEILGEEKVSGISVKNLETSQISIVKTEGVMVHIGTVPNSELVSVKKNKYNEIIVNQVGQTSSSFIWAAGDVTNHPYKQIAIAAGQGVSALLSIVEFLNRMRT